MDYIILTSSVILVLITGLARIIHSTSTLTLNHNFVMEFREKFIEFTTPYLQRQQSSLAESKPLDAKLYHWLVSNMDKTQTLLGIYGILAQYTSPFGRFQAANYPCIINTIPQIRTGEANRDDLLMCDDMMVRYLGQQERSVNNSRSKIKKPFLWLQAGLQFYVGLPIRLLYWFGIINKNAFSRLTSSQFFKVVSGIGGLVAFLASLARILQAWPTLRDLLK